MSQLNQQGMVRGDNSIDKEFYSAYINESNKKRNLEEDSLTTPDGFIVNEKLEYILANLKAITEYE